MKYELLNEPFDSVHLIGLDINLLEMEIHHCKDYKQHWYGTQLWQNLSRDFIMHWYYITLQNVTDRNSIW